MLRHNLLRGMFDRCLKLTQVLTRGSDQSHVCLVSWESRAIGAYHAVRTSSGRILRSVDPDTLARSRSR